MAVPSQIKELVDRFTQNFDAYKGSNYNETRARIEFIDPFFKELGWDINNTQGFAEAYKDVIHEDAIKVEGSTKAPDYSFRIGGQRKFFLEAKKPSVNVKDDIAPAFQLRRYAWNAGLPVSILTDFEEFAIYDATIRPNVKDRASTARLFYCTYDEYEKHWEYIASIFSKDAILKGSFDHFLKDSKKKKGTTAVDKEFLNEMEKWRTDLAKNIALRNTIEIHPLNYVVQATIDRILFLRICEDRNIEEYGRLQKLAATASVYKQLTKFFEQADQKYNSGLFHFQKEKEVSSLPDEISLNLKIDDKILKEIITALYYPSPYEFSVISADILGNVYEQFLGKVIRLTSGGQAKIEEKPEVKKAGGVYYTPQFIVKYIVENTVGELLKEKNPMMVAGKVKGHSALRILDPACGSGSFLINAYQYLLDWHRDWYEKDISQKGATQAKKWSNEVYQGPGDHWYLTTREKKRILLNSIFGVDIDHQAVEVTKLNLLLKVLEGENRETLGTNLKLFQERALPDLAENIKCGNSLIGSDFYVISQAAGKRQEKNQLSLALHTVSNEEKYRINAFDWTQEFPDVFAAGGFDAVIGNPPYLSAINVKKIYSPKILEYLKGSYEVAKGAIDLYIYFFEKTVNLTRENGLLAFITPNRYLSAGYGEALRNFFLKNTKIQSIHDYSNQKVFSDASTYPIITVLRRDKSPKDYQILVGKPHDTGTIQAKKYIHSSKLTLLTNNIWGFLLNDGLPLTEKIIAQSKSITSVCTINATSTASEADEYHQLINEKSGMKLINTGIIDRYCTTWGTDKLTDKGVQYKTPFLKRDSSVISENRLNQYGSPKIILAKIALRTEAFFDSQGEYASINTNCLHSFQQDIDPYYLLAWLNSKLFQYAFECFFDGLRMAGGYLGYNAPNVSAMFVKIPEISMCKRIVALSKAMIELTEKEIHLKTPDEKTRLQRQIEATDREIDKLVYELYGLTEEEIKTVEGVA